MRSIRIRIRLEGSGLPIYPVFERSFFLAKRDEASDLHDEASQKALFLGKSHGIIYILKSTNVKQKEVHMTKTVNYSPEMVSQMEAQAPLNLEKAKALSSELGRSVRSIIAKAKREGIAYVSVKPVAKRVKGQTKAELVATIAEKLSKLTTGSAIRDAADLEGLEKAPAVVLGKLLECL
jgi:hypothetical protein